MMDRAYTRLSSASLGRNLPAGLWRPLRALATAIVTPIRFATVTGHWNSSLAVAAQARDGAPLPWYTYPAIDFLSQRDFTDKSVLEFGGGQSTLWWAKRAVRVTTIEEDGNWYSNLRRTIPSNVDLHHVEVDPATRSVETIRNLLRGEAAIRFDVIIVDGHLRREIAAMAFDYLAPGGALLLDNSEGYGFHDEIKTRHCRRVDFFGFAPGVSQRHCTSLVYVDDCFMLDPKIPIAEIEKI